MWPIKQKCRKRIERESRYIDPSQTGSVNLIRSLLIRGGGSLSISFGRLRRRSILKLGGGGANILLAPCADPNSNFPKCPLRCLLAQVEFFAISTVSSVSVIDFWQVHLLRQLFRRYLGSSWVIWGQKMCTLIDVANATVAGDFSRQQNVGGCTPAPTNFCEGCVFGVPWPLLRAAYVDILTAE